MKNLQNITAVYKPKGPTSHDIVNQIRKITGAKKVGHAGTLDPLARGVLVVGIGREATKKLSTITAKEKEYLAVIKLGTTSTTDDEEGQKTKVKIQKSPTKQQVQSILKYFKGYIKQTPPIYSAVKIKGKEAYKLARQNKKVVLKPRKVEIKEVKIVSYKFPILKLKVVTGSGVYIRALARDIGAKLKIGGYLKDLERTRVGSFTSAGCQSRHKIYPSIPPLAGEKSKRF